MENKNKVIYFITWNNLPNGDASSVRNISLAQIFKDSGYNVELIGMGMSDFMKFEEYKGFPYVSLRLKGSKITTKLSNYYGYKYRLMKLLTKPENINALIINSLPINTLNYIKQFCKKNNIKLLIDCCEWYSPEEFKLGKLDINYINNTYFVQKYIDAGTYPIAISKYLEDYFRSKGCKTIRIPVIMDVLNISHEKRTNPNKLTLVYAGSPGKKDYLDVMLEGIGLLDRETIEKIDFRIIGINQKQLINLCSVSQSLINKLSSSLNIMGRIPRNDVLRNLEEADFTVLLRPSHLRYTKAGFPTKVVESFSSGTPVICNISSDLGDYMHDGINGFIVNNCSAKSFADAVKKAFSISYDERTMMYSNARKTAEDNFDYRKYLKLSDVLENNNVK